jgi:hypothetical protein
VTDDVSGDESMPDLRELVLGGYPLGWSIDIRREDDYAAIRANLCLNYFRRKGHRSCLPLT